MTAAHRFVAFVRSRFKTIRCGSTVMDNIESTQIDVGQVLYFNSPKFPNTSDPNSTKLLKITVSAEDSSSSSS